MLNVGRTDNRPTISEWPVRIWNMEELPPQYEAQIRAWIREDFGSYDFVYAPKRSTNAESFDYLFGYGNDRIIYIREQSERGEKNRYGECGRQTVQLRRQQVKKVLTMRELLNARITLQFDGQNGRQELQFPYIPSVYYLYDPFLNWVLGLNKEFLPFAAEQASPRPEKLYHESLAMFNYSLGAYRLGSGFSEYRYESVQHRCRWMPWKKTLEEWLDIRMERGTFELHSFGYLTECGYQILENTN